ncbi:MAG: DegT/DnrJ/EryC1/StrS family aminotransferase [Bacilli bacterium]|nr:DegT/DnrJ/EryC1/StrS family aminotransferase [Bacilli bacterium]
MKKITVPFSPPDISDEEVIEVSKALKSGWITTGPRTKQLEKELAEFIGVPTEAPNCVCLNSQTACAELVLRLLEIGEGDEVIAPAYTYTATASVIYHVGAKIVLIDSQKDSLEMDYDAVEKAITEKTKAIIPVSLGGVPCDYDRLFEIVNKKKALFKPKGRIQEALGRIAICEDTAHALGASKNGVMVGNISDFSSFSFHAVKNFTTGEGGALTWKHIEGIDDAEIYHQFQLLSLHGQSKDALKKNQPGMWEYDIVGPWYKCNMTDVAAAIGLAQFRRYLPMLERRKSIIKKYDENFKPLGVESLPHFADNYSSSGHLYISRVFKKNGCPITDEERREIIVKMAERGISCNVHYKPLPMHTAYKNLGFDIKNFPNAYAHYVNEITLPLHTCLTDEQVDYVIENYKEILKEYVNL